MNVLNKKWLLGMGLSLMCFGCGSDDDNSKGSIDLGSVTAGPKSDIGKVGVQVFSFKHNYLNVLAKIRTS